MGDIYLILAPFCTPSWWAVQRHTQFSWRCDIFTLARAKDVRKKALISAISVNLSRKRLDISHMFLVSSCASLRSANDRLVRLCLRCDFSALYNAKILFHTRTIKFCMCISRVVKNIESKFHLRITCGRWEMKPYSYILLTSQKFCTKIYIPHLPHITKGVLKFQPQVSTRSRIVTV